MHEITIADGSMAIVDGCDYIALSVHKWRRSGAYAVRNTYSRERRTPVKSYMHREIMAAPPGLEVDHINGNGLDNRRANLRLCRRADNSRNYPGSRLRKLPFKGMTLIKNGRFQVSLYSGGRGHFVGNFDRMVDAAIAYDEAALLHHGEFACINGVLPEHRTRATRCLLSEDQAAEARKMRGSS